MDWLVACYQPVALFSLKHGEATSTGGKTLLIPTPFAIRMALLDAALRTEEGGNPQEFVSLIGSLKIAIKPPTFAVVNGSFGKILKPERADREMSSERAMTPSIAFREYVFWKGELGIAFGGVNQALQRILPWLLNINYLGKRGGFIQLVSKPAWVNTEDGVCPQGYLFISYQDASVVNPSGSFSLGVLQRIDDWGKDVSFEKLNSFSEERISSGKERMRYDVILPYQIKRAGRGFALYAHV
ncbi:MAG: hypothetical protein ACPLUL_06415 [Thermanaerothrix sp.]|uniref:hypothetical protein n=1 Tax=Thermanaerothrix sp. TaxID=2972675 RepID=UPI003C7C4947